MFNIINYTEFDRLKKDFRRRFVKFKRINIFNKFKFYYTRPQYRTLLYYRLSKSIQLLFINDVLNYLYNRNSKIFGLEILTKKLGGGVIIPHFGRIIINAKEVGDNLYIFHNTTIGNDYQTGIPTIGNNVFIGTGSIVLGNITIGNNVVIGAGSCVLMDIPSNSLVVGNPAKVIKDIDSDYIKTMIGY